MPKTDRGIVGQTFEFGNDIVALKKDLGTVTASHSLNLKPSKQSQASRLPMSMNEASYMWKITYRIPSLVSLVFKHHSQRPLY